MANIRITDKQTVTPTGSDFMLINQAGSDKNTTLARLKTYMNGSTTLETVAQDTNSAINEVNAKATDASTGINGIKNTIGSGNLETTSQNIIGAVNEVNTKVGNEKLETVAENATGAINELNKKIGNVDIENDGDIATQLNANTQKIDEINRRTFSHVLWEGETKGSETITLNDNLNNYNKLIFIINKPGEFNFNSEYVDLGYPSNIVGDNVKAIIVPSNYIVMEFNFTTITIRSDLGELQLAKIIGVKDGVINYEN